VPPAAGADDAGAIFTGASTAGGSPPGAVVDAFNPMLTFFDLADSRLDIDTQDPDCSGCVDATWVLLLCDVGRKLCLWVHIK